MPFAHALRIRRYPDQIDHAPDVHGVYGIFSKDNECIYVGRADGANITIRSRLREHNERKDPNNTECINIHEPAFYRCETTEELRPNSTVEIEKRLIAEYKSLSQAFCNDRIG